MTRDDTPDRVIQAIADGSQHSKQHIEWLYLNEPRIREQIDAIVAGGDVNIDDLLVDCKKALLREL